MFERFLDVVFPNACCGCGALGTALCLACRPRESAVRRLRFDALQVTAAGPYAGALRKAVLAFKRGRRDAGGALAEFLVCRLGSRIPLGATLVPVPTAARRRRERGFDQSVRLANLFGNATNHSVLDALTQRAGDAQHGRNRSARLRARGRFLCTTPELVRGRPIVLLDDVVTTGSTLRDCTAALHAHGANVLAAIVIAYA